MKSINSSIAQASLIVGLFTIGSRLVGLLRARVFTSEFGAGQVLDIYYAAFRVPDILLGVFVLGTLSVAVVPIFTEVLAKDEDGAWRLASAIVNWTWVMLTFMVVVLWLLAPWFIPKLVPGFTGQAQAATIQLTRIILAGQILFGVSNLFASLLQSYRRFFWPAVAPVVYNIGIILGVLVFYPQFGLRGLGYGVLLGALMHFLVQVPDIIRLGGTWTWSMVFPPFWRDKLLKLYVPRLFFLDLVQISMIVASVLGSGLVAGSIGSFHLAYDVQAVPIGVFALAVAVASFPALSESYARQDESRYWRLLHVAVRNVLALVLPCSALLILLRAQAVRLLYGAGQFDWEATVLTLQVLGALSISLFAQSLIPIFSRAFFARHQAKVPVLIGLLGVVVNVLVSWIGVKSGLGTVGLAFGFTVSSIVVCGLLYFILFHTMHKVNPQQADLEAGTLLQSTTKLLIATLVMGVVCYAVMYISDSFVNTRTWIGLFTQSVLSAGVSTGVYIYLLSFFGIEGVRDILIRAKRLLNR